MTRTPRRTLALFALFIIAAALRGLAPAGAAQAGVERIDSREGFASAASGLDVIDFGAVAPARGFGKYRPEEGLSAGGVTFRASGGARFGPGLIYVVSEHYGGSNPLHNTGMLPHLSWGAPNQPGNASLDVTLPEGTTAVGCDLWTQQPYVSTVEVTATTADGRAHTAIVNTRTRPAGSFVGFISDAAIVSVSFRPPKGQTGLLLDNFTYGRKSAGRRVQPSATTAAAPKDADAGAPGQASRPTTSTRVQSTPDAQSPASRPGQSAPPATRTTPDADAAEAPASAANQSPAPSTPASSTGASSASQSPAAPGGQTAATTPTAAATNAGRQPGQSSSAPARGTIAYIRGGTEIRLVESDGSNDRRLWTHEYAKEGSAIHNLAWRPDGKELAFSSSHFNVTSFYHADIYAIGPDGKGFRKITNAPDHGDLARYPKGAVSVTVRNEQPIWKQGRASTGVFVVYVVGADEPQAVALPPGASRTLLFKSVADYGEHAQPVVAMYGQYRWFIPGLDVKAGRTTTAPEFGISGDGIPLFGAFRPVWRADGSRLSYRDGLCLVNTVPAQPRPGELVFDKLFAGEHPSGACAWDWGPTPALADQVIYSANSEGQGSSIHRVREGGAHPGTKLHAFSELDLQLVSDLRWLPDGSGFLYSFPDLAYEFGNIYRYDLATKRVTQLTNFEGEYARSFDVSPDGAWVVFERAKKWDEDEGVDLWIMRTDGRESRLLVRGGLAPSWR